MSCQQTHVLMHGYLDGELDLVRSLEIEQHLSDCKSCALAYKNQQALRSLVRDGASYYGAPVGLEQRIHTVLSKGREAEAKVGPATVGTSRPRRWTLGVTPRWVWAGMAAALALAAVVIGTLAPRLSRPSPEELLAQEVVASHIRALMPNHLTDVTSSDQHNVKPWFGGRLDFSPPVVDLTPEGFLLVGGRLDYLAGRPVAALVYQRRKHFINVFIWPSGSSGSPGRDSAGPTSPVTVQGYNLLDWTKVGMTYWVVSDLNSTELGQFARLLQER